MATTLYDTDYHAWCLDQAAALRRVAGERVNTSVPVAWENVAEELEDLGRSRARELRRHYVVLLLHLLKWAYQPRRRTRSWRSTIIEQRAEIVEVLRENPSLRRQAAEASATAYGTARKLAAAQTGLPPATFPEECPFTLAQAADEDFWPEPIA